MAERGRSGKRNFHPRNRGGGTSRQNSTSSNQSLASGNSGSPQVLYPSSSTLTTTTLFNFPPPNYDSLVAGYPQGPQQNNFLPFQNQAQLPNHGNFGNQQRVNQTLDNSHRGNWAGRARGNFQRGGQHGNQRNNQVGNQQEHQISNQTGNPFGNQAGIQFGNQAGIQFGNQGGNQFGNQGGNQFGNQGGRQRGNQGGNQRGNQGGYQRGNQGGNQQGNQGGNQRGNQGLNQRGNQGGNQRGNQGGNQRGNQGGNQRGNQGGNQRGNQGGNQHSNRGANYQGGTRQGESTQQASIVTPKSGLARFFSGVMNALDGVVTAVAQADSSPSRKAAQPRYRKQNQNVVHRVPTPETNQQQLAKAGGGRRRRPRQVSHWKQKKQQQQQQAKQSKNPNSGQVESNLLSFMRSSSLSSSTTELIKDDSDSDDSVYSTSSGYSTITNASEKRGNEIDEELSLMGYEVIGDGDTPVSSWLNDQNEATNKSQISISEPLEFSDGVVGVFWDIENCAVPSGKSAHDIVKKIRNTFYKGRKEEIFLVVCDIKNLSDIIVNELNNFQVKVEHVSSKSKNAADQKLKNSLIEFAMYDKPRGSCVVLITGDCDFASEIHTLRFKKNIHVILLHHKTSRKELVDTASETYLYEEFVGVEKYLVLMENIPEGNTLRTVLPLLVSPYQGKIEYPKSDPNQLLLIFPNEDKANELLNLLESGRTLSDGIKIKRQPKIRTPEINLAKSPSKLKSIKKDSKTSLEIPVVSEQIQKSENNSKNIKELLQAIKEEKSKVIQNQTEGIASVIEIDPTTLNEKKARHRKKKKGNGEQQDETTGTELQVTQPMKHLCKIILESSQNENKDFWLAYLELHLDKHSITDLELEGNKVILQIESLALAKRLKRKLEKLAQNAEQGFKVLSLIKNADESSKEQNSSVMMKQVKIRDSLAEISKNVTQFMKNHEKQIRHKDSELQALIQMEKAESSAKMDNFRKIHDIRQTTQAKKDELVKQRVVFEEHLERKIKEIESINLTLEQDEFDSKLREAMKDFGRECSAFKEALPIYAYKNYIIQVINKNKVCVLLAETGSGKSTQVTQYLCQAGYSQKGVIICTQPRKIAARSLVQHVSSQYGCKPGTDVSYQLNQKFDQGKDKKIVYSTDHSLLNECIKNPQLLGYSCIIVDEAHERSIFTDILLGMLQKILMKRNDLKLIITSATIDPKIFSDFFGVKSEAVLNIPGRTFPIEIIWGKKTVKANYEYMDESVSKVVEIHCEEQPGHILSFLPTPAETQKACDMFEVRMKSTPESNDTFVCLPLHGKLSAEDQNKVFAPSGNKRKVIFATNCAETSITIPGIKYVVDCGLEKALHYDPIKQSSSLLIGFVSKSSADQRKGRAGRTEAGKCYRLFSIENYNNMASETIPEILRVNLGEALLKLMDLGVNDPCQFQFVQSPPIAALRVAMASLERLGAIENGTKLTALGLKMSKMPVEPRLAKLVIRGQEEGIGYESLIVAALSSVSGIIFFRVEDNQAVADANKVTFSQEEGDFHTFLQVFMEWQKVPVKGKGSWCSKYCINGKSMKIADETVRELAQVFERHLNIQLNQTFSEDANAMQILQYLIFEAFSDNLSVFSGQRNLGYFTYKDKEQVHIHPSSALNYLGHITPTFIIFDTKMTTSRNFILNIVPVNDVLISLGYQTGIISENQIEEMKAMMYKRVSIGPFGKTALQHITGPKGKNKRLLEENLKKMTSQNLLSVEISFDSGLVEVFSHSEDSTIIKNVVNSNINEVLNNLKKEQRQLGDKLNDCRYILGPGMVVNTLLMPGEYRKIRIKNFLEGSVNSIISDLKSFGEVRSFRKLKKEILVTMETSKMASSVVSHFSKLPFEPGNKIIVVPDGEYNRKDQNRPMYRVKVGWCRRPSSGYGFLNFDTALNYQIGLTELLSRGHFLYKGKDLKFKMTKNQTQDSIHVSGLPEDATEEYLKTAIRTNFPHLNDMINRISVIRSKEFTTTDEQLKDLERQLADLFSRYTKRENLIIDIIQPRPKSMEYRAWVYFHNASDGDMAVRSLKSIGYKIPAADNKTFTLNLEPEIHSSILCRRELYTFLSDKIKSVLSGFENAKNSGDKLSVEAKEVPGTDMVRLEILSNNLREMEILFNNCTEIFKGYVLDCKGKPTLEKLLTDYGNNFLQELARSNGCKVYCDFRQKKVSIHSVSEASLTKSQIEINEYLNKIEGEASKDIYLIGNHIPKGFLKFILCQFGTDLEELVAQCSLTHVELDLRRHVITMHGQKNAIVDGEKALKVMMEACAQHSQLEDDVAAAKDGPTCPICFCPPEDPYRLEICGHSYCKDCIMSQLNTKEIPVACCQEDCKEALVMSDMKTLLDDDENLDLALQEASLEYLVLKNPDLYSFCPTPDCPVVYKKSVDNSDVDRLFECPKCSVKICRRCQVIEHIGMDCDFYQLYKDDKDFSIKKWIAMNPENRKICPKCRIGIEKNGGCNHMTCRSCSTHMCWLCLKTFQTGQEVYNHQPFCLGATQFQ